MILKRSLGGAGATVLVLAVLALVPARVQADTFTVNTFSDTVDASPGNGVCADSGGNCSLRAAIMEANAYPVTVDGITLPAGTYTLTIAGRDEDLGATGDLDIRGPLTINGAGADTTMIQAGTSTDLGIDKVISINPGWNAAFATTIRDVTIRHGRNTSPYTGDGLGGGLDWEASGNGTLTLENVTVTANRVERGDGGGLAVTNDARSAGQVGALVTLTNVTITNNRATAGFGGGIFVGTGTPIVITNSTITGNRSEEGTRVNTAPEANSVAGGEGGGIFAIGPALTGGTASRISNSTVSNNVVAGGPGRGGGLSTAQPIAIEATTFSGNQAAGNGGGLYISLGDSETMSLTNVTLSGNSATGAGGGLYAARTESGTGPTVTLTNVTVTNNSATGGGAGVNVETGNGSVVLRNTIVAGNPSSDVAGSLAATSQYNLIGTGGSGGLTGGVNSNQVGVANPGLAALGNNGGPTQTHALLKASPALDAGAWVTGFPNFDQRGGGYPRQLDAADADTVRQPDIGAYEAYPTISDVADQTVAEDSTLTGVVVYIGDWPESPGLTFTYGSANQALLPDGNITVTGSGGSRNLALAPGANLHGTATVTVTVTSGADSMTDTFTLTVTPVADLPSVSSPTVAEDTASTVTIDRSGADGTEVTHFKITAITGGSLYQNDGTTQISNDNYITYAQGEAGLKFRPAEHANSPAGGTFSFVVQGATSNAGAGLGVGATATITVREVNDAPTATAYSATAVNEDTPQVTIATATLLATASKGPANESGQTLTITVVSSPTGGTVAMDGANIVFTPAANYHGPAGFSYTVQDDGTTAGVADPKTGTSAVTFTVREVNDAPVPTDDTVSAVQEDSTQLTISAATLLANDSAGPVNENGQTLTVTAVSNPTGGTVQLQGSDVLFTPAAHFHGTASFTYTVQDNGTTAGASDPKTATATVFIPVTPVADPPAVGSATTDEDSQTAAGLVIARSGVDGVEVTHFKISGITGGTLYQNDGTTAITGGQFLTEAEAGAGLKFTPAANQNTAAGNSFTFTVQGATSSAGAGLGSGTTASITVNAVNDAPVAQDEILAPSAEDSGVRSISASSLFGNDSPGPNEAGQTLTIAAVSNPVGGTAELNGGNVAFTPAPNFSGGASFTYTVTDDATPALTDTATVSFTVTPVADLPTVTSATTDEDTLSSAGLVIARSTDDGAEVTHFKITAITGGKLYLNDGTTEISAGSLITADEGGLGLRFKPSLNANTASGGTFSFQVQGATNNSGAGLGPAATATITVTAVNDPPVPTADSLPDMAEDAAPVTIPFSEFTGDDEAGPADESGQTLTITAVGNATGGTVSIDGANIVFSPAGHYFGAAGFTYTVADNGNPARTATGSVSFTITEVNDDPMAVEDTLGSWPEDGGVYTIAASVLTANDSPGPGETGQALTIIGVFGETKGTASVVGGNIQFTPTPNAYGTAEFSYTLRDNGTTGGAADFKTTTGRVTFTLTPLADPPAVTEATTAEDSLSQIGLVITPNGLDGASVTHFRISAVTGGTLYKSNGTTSLAVGDFITAAEGATGLRFRPAADANSPAGGSFSIAVQGATSDAGAGLGTATAASITVSEVNDAPTVVADALSSMAEDAGTRVISAAALLANDLKGPENETGQSLEVTAVSDMTGGTATVVGTTVEFTPTANYNGAAGFTYTLRDNGTTAGQADPKTATGTVSFTITAVNDPPTGGADTLAAVDEDSGPHAIPFAGLLANDSPGPSNESGQTLTIISVSAVTGGTVSISGTDVLFTPGAGFRGDASFTYTLRDDGLTGGAADPKTATATVTIPVRTMADPPRVNTSTLAEDAVAAPALTITRNAADGDEVTHFKIVGVAGGTLYLNDGTTTLAAGDFITAAEGGAGLKFTPTANQNSPGGATFSVTVAAALNSSGDKLSGETVAALTVTEVNDAPTASADSLTAVAEDSGVRAIPVADLLANDSPGLWGEAGQTLTITAVNNPTGGSVVLVGAEVRFTPTANWVGTASFIYTVTDNGTTNGAADPKSVTATVSFAVTAVNDAPTGTDDALPAMAEDAGVRRIPFGDLLANDTRGPVGESGETLTLTAVADAVGGTVALDGTDVVFTPTANFYGTASFTYTVTDNGLTGGAADPKTATAGVAFSVTPVNDPPTAGDDTLSAIEEDSAPWAIPVVSLLANDSPGPAGEGDQTLTVTAVGSAQGGSVSLSGGTVSFTPAPNFYGNASFTYTVTDSGATGNAADPKTATGTVRFTVNGINDAPRGQDQTLSTTAGVTLTGNATATDVDGASFSFYLAGGPSLGSATMQTNGSFTYLARTAGTDSFDFTVMDSQGAMGRGTITITVAAAPITMAVPVTETRSAAIRVSGTTTPGLTVTVNGVTTVTGADGAWSAEVLLQEGSNTITAANGSSSATATVLRDSTPPVLILSASATVTTDNKVVITATSEAGAVITIDGRPTASLEVNLRPALNTFTATATDRLGNVATGSITVERSVPRAVGRDVDPGKPAEVKSDYVSVSLPADVSQEPIRLQVVAPQPSAAVDKAHGAATVVAVLAEITATTVDGNLPVTSLPKKVTLTFTYNPAAVTNPHELKVYYFDPATGLWVALGGVVDTSAHTITVEVDHFTLYAVFAPQAPAPVMDVLPAKVREASLVVGGNSAPGETVKLVVGGNIHDTAVVGVNGRYVLTAALAVGKNRIYVTGGGAVASQEATVLYEPEAPKVVLTDVPGHWAEVAIHRMVALGVVRGYEDATFRPAGRVSRLEFAVMVARLLKLTPGEGALSFIDAAQIPDWARGQVAAAVGAGIITGRSDGSFDPAAPVTRAEIAVMLTRALKQAGLDSQPGSATFADGEAIPAWAKDAVLIAARFRLVTGYEDSTFRAGNTATRAEAVTMLSRLLDALSR